MEVHGFNYSKIKAFKKILNEGLKMKYTKLLQSSIDSEDYLELCELVLKTEL